jgi:N-acetylglucosamine-6-phosphate deacetylase
MTDLHFHGAMNHDAGDATKEALQTIARYEASIGVTAICPATMTEPAETLERILNNAADFREDQLEHPERHVGEAELCGINMEGPFISAEKRGAQNEENILPWDISLFRRFQKAGRGIVKFIGIAPEIKDPTEFIEAVRDEVNVAIAHTNADYDTALKAMKAGAHHLVHMYNAMPEMTHRTPGVIGAAFDCKEVNAELICDGVHVHPSVIRSAFKMFGRDRIILMSDSIRAAGMGDGTCLLGGFEVKVEGKYARMLRDGAIAGSVTPLPDCVRILVKEMGIPLETAIYCATVTPAKELGIADRKGFIKPGREADLVFWNEDLSQKLILKSGLPV